MMEDTRVVLRTDGMNDPIVVTLGSLWTTSTRSRMAGSGHDKRADIRSLPHAPSCL